MRRVLFPGISTDSGTPSHWGRLKVVHLGIGIVPVPPGDKSAGREEYIYQLTKHLGRLGCQVDVIDITGGAQHRERRQRSSVKFHEVWHLPLPSRYTGRFLRRYIHYLVITLQTWAFALLSAVKLGAMLAHDRIDLIHAHDRDIAIAAAIANRLTGKTAVVLYTPQGAFGFNGLAWYRKYVIDAAEILAFRLVDHVIALTPAARHWLMAEYGLQPEKVSQIYVGTAVDEIRKSLAAAHGPCHQSNEVLCVGVISLRKNQFSAVKAIARVVSVLPDVKLVCVGPIGDTDYFREIRQFVTEHTLSASVEFRGEVSRRELHTLYCKAAVFLFPTIAEVQPTVLMEALAFGLPVVASNIGPIADVVGARDECAVLCDPYDVEAMAAAVVKLLRDGEIRRSMSQQATEVAQMFSYDRVAAQTVRLYTHLVEARR